MSKETKREARTMEKRLVFVRGIFPAGGTVIQGTRSFLAMTLRGLRRQFGRGLVVAPKSRVIPS